MQEHSGFTAGLISMGMKNLVALSTDLLVVLRNTMSLSELLNYLLAPKYLLEKHNFNKTI
jgi:hypothetical protein